MGIFGRKQNNSVNGNTSDPATNNLGEIVAKVRTEYEAGHYDKVYKLVKKYESIVFRCRDSAEDDWFWFYAFAALASLKSHKPYSIDVAGLCGFATSSGFGDASMKAAKEEIYRLAEPYRI